MIYIKKIFNQDIKHQIAVTKDPSLYFFKQSIEEGKERKIIFHYFSPDGNYQKESINASIKGYKIECRINGDFKGFLEKNFKLEEGDIIAFKDSSKDVFNFTYIKKNEICEKVHKVFEIFDDNHCLFDEEKLTETLPDTISKNRIIFGAPGTGKSFYLKEEAAKYFGSGNEENTLQSLRSEVFKLSHNMDSSRNVLGPGVALGIKYYKVLKKFIGENGKFKQTEFTDFIKDQLTDEDLSSGTLVDNIRRGVLGMTVLYPSLIPLLQSPYERVTFHPNYSYANFVGAYKPIMKKNSSKEEVISYEFVPGPFIRTYIKAITSQQPQLLLIEEINRANVAAVFGDIFQLLDRDDEGNSVYPIQTSKELRDFLARSENLGGEPDDYCTLSIPSNMYIWATMNSADQGVLPMDAAFKRRWDFEYLDVDNEDAVNQIKDIEVPISRDGKKKVKWNDFRVQLNDKLSDIGVNEDKLLGPFFLSEKSLKNAMVNPEKFVELFESKIIMYLFEDVVKMQPSKLFVTGTKRYSKICKEFEEKGMELFGLNVEVTEVQ